MAEFINFGEFSSAEKKPPKERSSKSAKKPASRPKPAVESTGDSTVESTVESTKPTFESRDLPQLKDMEKGIAALNGTVAFLEERVARLEAPPAPAPNVQVKLEALQAENANLRANYISLLYHDARLTMNWNRTSQGSECLARLEALDPTLAADAKVFLVKRGILGGEKP